MGFVGCLEKPPSTPTPLRNSKKIALSLTIDESFRSPKQSFHNPIGSLNDELLCQTDESDKFQTPTGTNRAVVKQSSWAHIDLILDSLDKENTCEANTEEVKSPIARKTIRLDTKKKSAKMTKSDASRSKHRHHEEPATAEKDPQSTHSAENLCRSYQSPVRRLVRTLSSSSVRSILSSPRRRTQLRSQLSFRKLDDETKKPEKESSQRCLRKSGSFRLCATETGAVDTSTPEAVLRQMSLSPKRKGNVKKQHSDSRLVSPKPKLSHATSIPSLISPVKSRSQNRQKEASIGSARSKISQETKEFTVKRPDFQASAVKRPDFHASAREPKTWNDLILEFDSITYE